MNSLLLYWVLPSLIMLLIILQIRHLDGDNLVDWFRYKVPTFPVILMSIIWPIGVFILILAPFALLFMYLSEKFCWDILFDEWK